MLPRVRRRGRRYNTDGKLRTFDEFVLEYGNTMENCYSAENEWELAYGRGGGDGSDGGSSGQEEEEEEAEEADVAGA